MVGPKFPGSSKKLNLNSGDHEFLFKLLLEGKGELAIVKELLKRHPHVSRVSIYTKYFPEIGIYSKFKWLIQAPKTELVVAIKKAKENARCKSKKFAERHRAKKSKVVNLIIPKPIPKRRR